MSESNPVLISLGSNIEPLSNLKAAVWRLAVECDLTRVSRVFETSAVGERPMPDFLNAAVEIRTDLTPHRLRSDVLRSIESHLGRRRSADRNAPRTIDLDIGIFGDLVIEEPDSGFVIPDPEILTRPHVALPLADIAPEVRHPTDGRRLGEIAASFAAAKGIRPAADAAVLQRILG